MYGVILRHNMCDKVCICFASDVDTAFGGGVGGLFEVGVEDEVGYDNGSSVDNDRKYEVDL